MIVSFRGYNMKLKEADDYKKDVCKVITQFIINDKDFLNDHQNSPLRDLEKVFNFKLATSLTIEYYYGDYKSKNNYFHEHNVRFTPEEYNRLKEFMKNPDLNINLKKYNL